MTVHKNESSVSNILFFKIAKIAGVHINMDTSEETFINVHIKDGKIIRSKACVEVIFYKNLDEPSMITNPTIFFL